MNLGPYLAPYAWPPRVTTDSLNRTYGHIAGAYAPEPYGFYQPSFPAPACDTCGPTVGGAGILPVPSQAQPVPPQAGCMFCSYDNLVGVGLHVHSYCGRPDCPNLQHVGALPPPSADSEQAQVSDQLSTRVVLIGVLATLAAAAVIYQTRKA